MHAFWSLAAVLTLSIPWLAVGGNAQETSSASVNDLITQLPSCALSCIVNAVSQSECALTDLSCICTSQDITDVSEPCIKSECTIREALLTKRLQSNTCNLPVRDRSGLLRRVQWICFGLAIAAVIFRILSKLPVWKGADLWWDDWSILACLLVLVGSNVVLHRMINNGLGKDIWMLTPSQIIIVQKLYWYSAYTYVAAMHGIKISIVLLYIRIFPQESVPKWFTKACHVLIVSLFVSALALCVGNAASCSPVEYNWLQWDGEHEGHCINKQALVFANAAINIFFDLIVFLMPLPLVIPLRISKYRKFGACMVFLIGLFVTVCSIIRLQYLVYWGNTQNPTWDNTDLALWSSIEANWAMICACMPSMAGPIKSGWRKARHVMGQYSAGSGSTLIISRSTSPQNVRHAAADLKGFEERQYSRPIRSYEDMELANHPVTRQSSF